MRAGLLLILLLMGCKGEVGDICEHASDCAGDLCIDRYRTQISQCTQECPCDEGQKCDGGVFCVVECSSSDPKCPDGTVCYPDLNECLPICEVDSDCQTGRICSEGFCV